MNRFTIGDFAIPAKGCSPLSHLGRTFERAIVVSVIPWVLVSEDGSAVWTTTSVHACEPAGHSTPMERKKAEARWDRECFGSRASEDPTPACEGANSQDPVLTLHRTKIIEVLRANSDILSDTDVANITGELFAASPTSVGGKLVASDELRSLEKACKVSGSFSRGDNDRMGELRRKLNSTGGEDGSTIFERFEQVVQRLYRVDARAEVAKAQLVDQLKIDAAVREVLHTVGAARYTEDDYALAAAIVKKHLRDGSGTREIDLDQGHWQRIKQAAMESKWMPPEYMKNHWVSDVCQFLREGNLPETHSEVIRIAKLLEAQIVGHLPDLGYLPDNSDIRMLLGNLRSALKGRPRDL